MFVSIGFQGVYLFITPDLSSVVSLVESRADG